MNYFITTPRIGFTHWCKDNAHEGFSLWSSPQVCRYITLNDQFSTQEIANRLQLEEQNLRDYGVQYFPIYHRQTASFMGCCGLRPTNETGVYEVGFHLLPEFWGRGYAKECGKAVIDYAFQHLHAKAITAGHHPQNVNSQKVLLSLGFVLTGTALYPPTGLMHPSYRWDVDKNC